MAVKKRKMKRKPRKSILEWFIHFIYLEVTQLTPAEMLKLKAEMALAIEGRPHDLEWSWMEIKMHEISPDEQSTYYS